MKTSIHPLAVALSYNWVGISAYDIVQVHSNFECPRSVKQREKRLIDGNGLIHGGDERKR